MSRHLLRRKISEKKLMLRRRGEPWERGARQSSPRLANINIFFSLILLVRETDFAEKEGILVISNNNENKVLLGYSRAN